MAGAITALVLVIGYFIAVSGRTSDTQILSGKVTGKSREEVHCRHSYSCNCREECSGSGSSRSCSTHCDTCYFHNYDVDWNVQSTIGTFTINTIDWQGLRQPPRWTEVRNNDPVSRLGTYQNYIKGVPGSLYRRINDPKYKPVPYPDGIYDYYKIDRVVNVDAVVPENDLAVIDQEISNQLRDLAALKQVNLILVLTKNTNKMFSQELKTQWLGGKKNDLVIVISTTNYPAVNWVEVFSWSKFDLVNTTVRDAIRDYGRIDPYIITIATGAINKYWQRNSMKNFAYLKNEIEPSLTAYLVVFLVSLVISGIVAVVFIRNDVA